MTSKKLSDEERALFRQTMYGVRPLADDDRVQPPAAPSPALPRKRWQSDVSANDLRSASDSRRPPEGLTMAPRERDKHQGERAQPAALAAAQRQLHKRLVKGEIRFTDQLDLHGKTASEAEVAVKRFVEASLRDRVRCVLLISGKGYSSPNGAVLRPALERWLKDLKHHQHIADYCPALPRDGGSGAFYVLL